MGRLSVQRGMSEIGEKIETLYYSASERRKSRLALATLGLLRLSSVDSKNSAAEKLMFRKEILAPIANPKRSDPKLILKEIASKDWQKRFTDNLIQRNILIQRGNCFEVNFEARQELMELFEDSLNGQALKLKAILWPSEYAKEEETYEEEEELSEMAESLPDPALNLVEELSARLEGVQGALQTMVDHLKQVYTGLEALETRASKSADTLEKLVNKLESENKVKLTGLLDRLIESEARSKSLKIQLDSETNRRDPLVLEVREALKRLSSE